MKYTGKIKKVNQYQSQADNKDYLDVHVAICEGDKEIDERRLGFPFGTKQEQIEQEVAQVVKTYEHDEQLAEESAKVEAAKAEAAKVQKSLTGKTINPYEKDKSRESKDAPQA